MKDDKDRLLRRFALKWLWYINLRSGELIKWIYEHHPGIAAGDRFLGNMIEKLIQEGNVEGAQRAFDDFVKQEQAARKLKKIFNE